MHQYIRTSVVKAEPMTYGEAYKSGLIPENSYISEYDDASGYLLIHMDGFRNWKPKEVFEEEYEKVEGMTFGHAIKALKAGHKVLVKAGMGDRCFSGSNPPLRSKPNGVRIQC